MMPASCYAPPPPKKTKHHDVQEQATQPTNHQLASPRIPSLPLPTPPPPPPCRGQFKISRRANASANAQALAAARAHGFGEAKAIGNDNARVSSQRVLELEGSPYLGIFGFLEWVAFAFITLGW